MRGLQPYPVVVPLASGLQTKDDPRAQPVGGLSVCQNGIFDEIGGIQTRLPYSSLSVSIKGGGTLANVRKIVEYGDELLCFTKDTLYSWSERDGSWVSKGTHLAAATSERPVFIDTGDQHTIDRAEHGGTAVLTWFDAVSGGKIAAYDIETGAVVLAPTAVNGTRLRVVATLNRILLFYVAGGGTGDFIGKVLNPTDLATSLAGSEITILAAANVGGAYDVEAAIDDNGNPDVYAIMALKRAVTTSYTIASFNESGTASASTKARTLDDTVSISQSPTGAAVLVVRSNGTNIQGDELDDTFADQFVNQAIGTVAGTPVNQIAAAYQTSNWRIWWSAQSTSDDTPAFECKSNTYTIGGTPGTQAVFRLRLGVCSRAFRHDGNAYVWLAFAGESTTAGMGEPLGIRAQLQNTFFLYRGDGHLVAKAAMNTAGGFNETRSQLANVQSTGTGRFTWAALERRIISTNRKRWFYADRGPREVVVTFDSNEARRCARLGETLYVSGGQVLQYDGIQLVEVGFHLYPWFFSAVDGGAASGSGKTGGSVAYSCTWSYENGKGEFERSTTATGHAVSITAGNKTALGSTVPLQVTRKTGVSVEFWATVTAAPVDSSRYLVTSNNPALTSNPNRYLANSPTSSTLSTVDDEYSDATLQKQESNPENGGFLENLSPPSASILVAGPDRLFLAGVAGAPYQIWYSKTRNTGELASFHDTCVVEMPPDGGAITALAYLNETLVVFKETAIYMLPGDGFDNAGQGANFGPARLLSSDMGAVSMETVAVIPQGVVFKSNKGWYLLDRSWNTQYLGRAVAAFDSDTVVSAHVLDSKHRVHFLTTSRLLVWDFLVNQWSEHTLASPVSGCLWQGIYHYATSSQVFRELSGFTATMGAVNTTTDVITISGQEFFTGAGPIRLSTTNTLPAPLVTGTDYFLVRVSATEVKFATSYANALAGTAINLTDTGAGTHTISCGGHSLDVELPWLKMSELLGRPHPMGHSRVWWLMPLGEYRSACRLRIRVARDYLESDASGVTWFDDKIWTVSPTTVGGPLQVRHGPSIQQNEALKVRITSIDTLDTSGPDGEGIKLTALGMECGVEVGLWRNLPTTQKQ